LKIKNDGLDISKGQEEICSTLLFSFFRLFLLNLRAVIFDDGSKKDPESALIP
jgi:hypothetical protein